MDNNGFNINSFIRGSGEEKNLVIVKDEQTNPVENKPKKGRKKKEDTIVSTVVSSEANTPAIPQTSMSYIQENIPYATAYQETNRQLDESIAQLNALGGEIVSELQAVRSSKTLKNKYNYINDMTATAAMIINSKISAIKEKNKSINDINHLELTRLKELKSQANMEDDNVRIASMYDAFVNTPVGIGRSVLGPSIQDMTIADNPSNLMHLQLGNNDQTLWEQSLDPAQNRMVLEAKGTIDTVVMYDESTGNRWFEIIDKSTGQPVPNVEKPDSTYIYDLDINIRGGFAKDSNRNMVYPLIVIHNGDSSIVEY